jgi:hypothetical protein
MNEGTHATLILDGEQRYDVSYYKVTDNSNLCHTVELIFTSETPDFSEESYVARLETNGDATWFFPWVVIKDVNLPNITASVYGGIFCPFGLNDDEEERYSAMNLIIVSDLCYEMTQLIWRNFLLVLSDWLKTKSVPQYKDYISLANQIEDEEDEEDNED